MGGVGEVGVRWTSGVAGEGGRELLDKLDDRAEPPRNAEGAKTVNLRVLVVLRWVVTSPQLSVP